MQRLRKIIIFAIFGSVPVMLHGCGPEDSVDVDNSVSIVSDANWLAYQDGPAGPWTVLESNNAENEANAYSFRVSDPEARFSLALACHAGTPDLPHQVELFFGTTIEVWRVRSSCRNLKPAPEKIAVTGRIDGVDVHAREAALITFSDDEWFVKQVAYAEEISQGGHDILAYKGPAATNAVGETVITPERFFIARQVQISVTDAGMPQQNINFNNTLAFDAPAETNSVTLGGAYAPEAGETRDASVGFISSSRNYLLLGTAAGGDSITYHGLPLYRASDTAREKPLQQSDEGHQATVKIMDGTGQTLRAGYRFFKTPQDFTLAPPAAAVSANPVVRFVDGRIAAVWAPLSDDVYGAASLYRWQFDSATPNPQTASASRWNVYVTPAWLGETPIDGYVFTAPDLSKLKSWQSAWGQDTSAPTEYVFRTYLSNESAFGILDFLLYRDVTDGLSFGEVVLRGQM